MDDDAIILCIAGVATLSVAIGGLVLVDKTINCTCYKSCVQTKEHPCHDNDTSANRPAKSLPLDDLICPITLELPIDPVTAEDGRCYEREAIEEYFASRRWEEIRSCHTNEMMGTRILPAPHIKNLIETLADHNSIAGELVDHWKLRTQIKRTNATLLKKAEKGDVNAMVDVALNYYKGTSGMPKDNVEAYRWFEKAHQAGNPVGTATMGLMLANGDGVGRDEARGAMFLCIAAGMGSNLAACLLGEALANGELGLRVDHGEAIRWLQLSLSENCPFKHMNDEGKVLAKAKLDQVRRNSKN